MALLGRGLPSGFGATTLQAAGTGQFRLKAAGRGIYFCLLLLGVVVHRRWLMAARFDIAETRSGDVTVLTLSGRLVADEEDLVFAYQVGGLLAENRIHIVVDFHDVTSIDSGGVCTLVAKLVSVRRRGGDMRLVRVTDRTRRVLEITRLLSVFQVFESTEEAIHSFSVDVPQLPAEVAVRL